MLFLFPLIHPHPPVHIKLASINAKDGNVIDVYWLGIGYFHVVCRKLGIDFVLGRDSAAVERILKGFYGIEFNAYEDITGKLRKFAFPINSKCVNL